MSLHIANSHKRLDEHIEKIKRSYAKSITTASKLLNLKDVDVVFVVDPSMVIPEIGIGGYTPNRYLVYVYIDPDSKIDENELYNTLCHELHHAKRYEGPGYGKTLIDSIIFEGLATVFEEEVAENDAYIPTELNKRKNTPLLIEEIKDKFTDENFEHFKWFIYDSSGEMPRWTGYEAGYYLVKKYLSHHKNKKASDLVLEATGIFYK